MAGIFARVRMKRRTVGRYSPDLPTKEWVAEATVSIRHDDYRIEGAKFRAKGYTADLAGAALLRTMIERAGDEWCTHDNSHKMRKLARRVEAAAARNLSYGLKYVDLEKGGGG